MPSLTCPTPARLRQFAHGEAAGDAALADHVSRCPACARLVAGVKKETDRAGATSAAAEDATMPPQTPDDDRTVAPAAEPPGRFDFLAPPQAPDEIGRLGPYRVLKILGRGGMGMVFLAEETSLDRTVALKVMLPEQAARSDARERFLREARAAAKIEHDNVIAIYRVDEDRGVPYIAMPLLKGMSLEDFLKRKQQDRPLEPAKALKLGREIARGLAAAHEKGLIHRDIKPANVWLDATANGRVKILDFGLARGRRGDPSLTQEGVILGTPSYMAPEQARGEPTDGRADLFSLGVVLYRLCTGRLPFRGNDTLSTLMALATEQPAPPQSVNPDVPPALAALVMHLLEKDPNKRVATAQDVVKAIQGIEKSLASSDKTAALPPVSAALKARAAAAAPAKAKGGRTGLLLAAGAGLLALAAGVAAFMFWPSTKATLRVETADREVRVALADVPDPREAEGGGFAVPPGEHALTVRYADLEFQTEKVSFARGETVSVAVEVRRGKVVVRRGERVIGEAALPASVVQLPGPDVEGTPNDVKRPDKKQPDKKQPIKAPEAKAEDASPFDRFRRSDLSAGRLKSAGKGDASKAPRELVGVIAGNNHLMSLSPNGRTLALVRGGTPDPTVKIHDVTDGTETDLGTFPVNAIYFSHDGRALAVSHGAYASALWDVQSKRRGQVFSQVVYRHVCVEFLPDDRGMIVGSPDTHTSKGDKPTMLPVNRNNKNKTFKPVEFESADVSPHCLALSADGAVLAAAGTDTKIRGTDNAFVKLWSATTGKLLGTLSERHRPVTVLRFSPDGKRLARVVDYNGGHVDVFDVATRKQVGKFEGHGSVGGGSAVDVSFDPRSSRAASCDPAGNVFVWDSKTRTRKRVIHLPNAWQVQWAPDGRHLLVRGSGPVYVLRLPSEEKSSDGWVTLFNGGDLKGWEAVGAPVWSVANGAMKADGKGVGWLASASDTYGDYELELEYRLPVKGNSGIFLRAWKGGAVGGGDFPEIQLIDEKGYANLKANQRTASLYNVTAPDPAPDAPAGRWHAVRARVEGAHVTVHFNGKRVLDAEMKNKETSGRIGLQTQNTAVEFRDVRVRELKKK